MEAAQINEKTNIVNSQGTRLLLECGNMCFKKTYYNDYVTKYENNCILQCIELKSHLILQSKDAMLEYKDLK